ncbi:carbonic anhydrase [Hortaea werneckii]|nr:carbonic anhydrase [Hortaea werneckii]KAI7670329.1 carbonic anhydrase [Hortaea werneckii]KAI7705756.1 carbonic anhydrase [Hortaea werneckii]
MPSPTTSSTNNNTTTTTLSRSFTSCSPRPQSAFQHALKCNHQWAETTQANDPDFFPTCAQGQAPRILWLGCSDSRAPETTLLGLKPGDVFTHRNIANIISPTDLSLLSVVEFSVFHLKVQHIVVCGHTSCGGVAGSMANGKLGGPLDIWLQPMRALREKHAAELAKLDGAEKMNHMAKLNVSAGVDVLKRIPTVIDAMRERGLEVHGVLYHLASGKLEEVECKEDESVAKGREEAFERK